MKRWTLTIAFVLLSASIALAQGSTNIRATDPSTGTTTQVGDSTNQALRVTFVGSVGTAGSPASQVVTIQGIASMTPLQVSALPAGTNTIGGVTGALSNNTAAPGAGNNMAAMPCVVGTSAPTYIDGRLVYLRCDVNGHQYVNVANGSLVEADDGSLASGQSAVAVTIPLAYRYNGSGWVREVADPCSYLAKTYVPFSIASATTTQLIAASSSNYNYICSINIVVGAANNVALVEDDTSACASPTAGMAGGTTGATGWNFAANGGVTFGSGLGTVFKTASTNRYTCFITTTSAQTSGTISYVQVP